MKSKKPKNSHSPLKKREMKFKEDFPGTIYGQVTSVFGNCNFNVYSFDDQVTRQCHLRKAAKKSGRAEVNTIVLLGLRDFQTEDNKADIFYVYTSDETKVLQHEKLIPKILNKNEFENQIEDDVVEFVDFEDI